MRVMGAVLAQFAIVTRASITNRTDCALGQIMARMSRSMVLRMMACIMAHMGMGVGIGMSMGCIHWTPVKRHAFRTAKAGADGDR